MCSGPRDSARRHPQEPRGHVGGARAGSGLPHHSAACDEAQTGVLAPEDEQLGRSEQEHSALTVEGKQRFNGGQQRVFVLKPSGAPWTGDPDEHSQERRCWSLSSGLASGPRFSCLWPLARAEASHGSGCSQDKAAASGVGIMGSACGLSKQESLLMTSRGAEASLPTQQTAASKSLFQ